MPGRSPLGAPCIRCSLGGTGVAYNRCDWTDYGRFSALLSSISGRRLIYAEVTGALSAQRSREARQDSWQPAPATRVFRREHAQ